MMLSTTAARRYFSRRTISSGWFVSGSFGQSKQRIILASTVRKFSGSYTSGQPPKTTETTKTTTSRLRNWWKSGNLLIALGWSGLALIVVDRYLQYADRQEAGNMVAYIEREQHMKRKALMDKYKDSPTLFNCVVRQEYNMGGSHGVKGVKLNDTLEILEERVGPSASYNLCRRKDGNGEILSIGWYPIGFLEKETKKKSPWYKVW